MRKVVLTLKEQEKYDVIKRVVETNGNKERAAIKLKLTIRQIDRLVAGYKKFGKAFFIHGNKLKIYTILNILIVHILSLLNF